jgi:hypothetical protein
VANGRRSAGRWRDGRRDHRHARRRCAPARARRGAPSAPSAVRSLEQALHREQKKVALVQEVSRALTETGDLDALLILIMAKVTELMEADRSTLYLVTEDGGQLWSKVSQGGDRVEIRLEVGEGIAGWVAQTREIVNIPDAYADQRFQPVCHLCENKATAVHN